MLDILILAIVQGLTEFLPVSSSGHLVLLQSVLGKHEGDLFLDIVLHVGTLGSVVVVYWRDLVRLLRLDGAAAFKKFLEKKHDVAWMGWSTSMRPQFWEHFHSANAHKPQTNNITNTDLARMDSLIDRYRASLDEQERIDLAWQIQALVHEQAAFVPTFMVPYVRLGYWRWMRLPDFHGTRRSDDLFDPFSTMTGGLFWIDGKLRSETREAMKKGRSFAPVTIRDERYKK